MYDEIDGADFCDPPTYSFVHQDDASTPLEPDEIQDLIPSWVTFRHELNEVEQQNIARGKAWALRKVRRRSCEILDDGFLRELHSQMIGDVWGWAGKFRLTERNVGVAPFQMAPDLRNLLADTKMWVAYKTYSADELIARFHHRLVKIHPFPNGNGRHGRLMADLLAIRLEVEPFTWGGKILTETSELRRTYISALQQADRGLFTALAEFGRS